MNSRKTSSSSPAWAICCLTAISRSAARKTARSPRTTRNSRSATTSTGSEAMADLIDPADVSVDPAHTGVDLSDVPVIDNHCHAIEASQVTDVPSWRRYFTESPDESMRRHHVAHTAFYRRLIRAMSQDFVFAGSEESVLQERGGRATEEAGAP